MHERAPDPRHPNLALRRELCISVGRRVRARDERPVADEPLRTAIAVAGEPLRTPAVAVAGRP